MSTYRVRYLWCIQCNEKRRARLKITDGVEETGVCPVCNTDLLSLSGGTPSSMTPSPFGGVGSVPGAEVSGGGYQRQSSLSWLYINKPIAWAAETITFSISGEWHKLDDSESEEQCCTDCWGDECDPDMHLEGLCDCEDEE